MARYTTRVELHAGNEGDYNELHKAMSGEGFTRYIQDSAGKNWRLPTAEYNRDTALDVDAVLASAQTAARKTGCTFEVLVTKSDSRRWYNLDEI